MLSSAIVLGLGLSVFFLIVVPWLAFSGRREARAAREGLGAVLIRVDGLKAEVEGLRREVARLTGGAPEPALPPPMPQPDAAAVATPAAAAQPCPPAFRR